MWCSRGRVGHVKMLRWSIFTNQSDSRSAVGLVALVLTLTHHPVPHPASLSLWPPMLLGTQSSLLVDVKSLWYSDLRHHISVQYLNPDFAHRPQCVFCWHAQGSQSFTSPHLTTRIHFSQYTIHPSADSAYAVGSVPSYAHDWSCDTTGGILTQ